MFAELITDEGCQLEPELEFKRLGQVLWLAGPFAKGTSVPGKKRAQS